MESFERKETKYLITPAQYNQFLTLAGTRLVPAEYAEGDVASLYYDTPEHTLINRSMAGPKYKEKLRVRSYGPAQDASPVYVEVKKKFKGIVYKRRVGCTLAAARAFLAGMDYEEAVKRWPLADAAAREESLSWKSLQVAGEIAWMRDHYEGLAPKMLVSTRRTSLVGADDPGLRVTFDAAVRWNDAGAGGTGEPGLARPSDGHDMFADGERILEVKCADAYPMWLVEILGACGIRPQSVSKYGRAYQAAMAVRGNHAAGRAVPRPAAVAAPVPARQDNRPRNVAATHEKPHRFRLPSLRAIPRHAVA